MSDLTPRTAALAQHCQHILTEFLTIGAMRPASQVRPLSRRCRQEDRPGHSP